MEKTIDEIYCFSCSCMLEFKQWVKHATHHSSLYYFPPNLLTRYKFICCVFRQANQFVFRMQDNFSGKFDAVSVNEITPDQYLAQKKLFQLLFNHKRKSLCMYRNIVFDQVCSSLIITTPFYERRLIDIIEQYTSSQVLKMFIKVCEDVAFLHKSGFIHGNLWFENIWIDNLEEETPIIIQIDNAQEIGNPNKNKIYEFTNKYILAPEIVTGKQINEKFDVWGLGILLHQFLAERKYPFLTDNNSRNFLNELRKKSKEEQAESFLRIDSSIKEDVKEIVKSKIYYFLFKISFGRVFEI